MIRVCICDDELALCHDLRELLQQYMGQENIEIVEYSNISELMSSVFPYDVLFLDIRFHGEDVGVEAAKQLRQKGDDAIIVFLTSLPQNAPDGYEADAFRYLLKPVKMDKLTETMNAVIAKIESQHVHVQVVVDSGIVLVEADDIRYIESTARRRVIYTKEQVIETWETMEELYTKLPKDRFIHLQKGFVSNISNIQRVKNNFITLKSGLEVPLSRNYKQDFLIAFNRYVGDGR